MPLACQGIWRRRLWTLRERVRYSTALTEALNPRVFVRIKVRREVAACASHVRESLIIHGDDRKLFLESSGHATEDGPEVNVSPLPSVSCDSRCVKYSTDVLCCVQWQLVV